MIEILLSHQPAIRLGGFAGIFAAMALWEFLAPRRKQAFGRSRRWPSNLGVVVLDTLLVRLAFPTTAVGVALIAEAARLGVLSRLRRAVWLAVVACGDPARSRHLSSARAVPRRAGALAAAPHAPRRSRLRRDDRRALPPGRDPAVDGDQARRDRRARRSRRGGADLRGAAQRHLDVQPRQRAPAGAARPFAALARRHARHAPRAPFDRCRARPTAISASIFRGGTGCSAPIAPSRRRGTRP